MRGKSITLRKVTQLFKFCTPCHLFFSHCLMPLFFFLSTFVPFTPSPLSPSFFSISHTIHSSVELPSQGIHVEEKLRTVENFRRRIKMEYINNNENKSTSTLISQTLVQFLSILHFSLFPYVERRIFSNIFLATYAFPPVTRVL